MPKFLHSTAVRVGTLFLILQAALLYSSVRPETIPDSRPLADFPVTLDTWQQDGPEGVVDEESRAILNADDLLTRNYRDESGRQAGLFVAGFRTQRNGKAPHSPKNCLPGSGWTQVASDDQFPVEVGAAQPLDSGESLYRGSRQQSKRGAVLVSIPGSSRGQRISRQVLGHGGRRPLEPHRHGPGASSSSHRQPESNGSHADRGGFREGLLWPSAWVSTKLEAKKVVVAKPQSTQSF